MSAKLAGKRKYPSPYVGMRRMQGPLKRRRTERSLSGYVVPGVTRVGGFYGRYSGVHGELKFHDVDVNDATISAGGTILNAGTINIIPQGVTESQRIGRKCTIKSIGWRWRLSLLAQDAGATPVSADTVRVIMYLDKQCNGATAAASDLIESDDFQSFNNLSNSQRFVTLMDRTVTLNVPNMASDAAGVVSSSNYFVDGTFFKKCDIPIEFNSTTGAIAEIRSNNLGILVIGFTGNTVLNSKIRLRFSDN